MNTATVMPLQPVQMIVTLEDKSMATDIKRALMLIRGIASVRMARINKAREESARGETIVCNTPEELQKYFDNK